jgi:hypothetical protein
MRTLRTPDERFIGLPEFSFPARSRRPEARTATRRSVVLARPMGYSSISEV